MRSVKSLIAAGAAIPVVVGGICRRHGHRAAPRCMRRPRWSRISAAGICAATSASATSASSVSNNAARCRPPPRRSRASASTPPASSASASVTRFNNWFRADVTGEYRGNSQFFGTDRITFPGGVGTDTYHAHQVRVGRSRQRLCRSRHLVVHHPVHRRRRRRRAGQHRELHRSGHRQHRRRRAAEPRLRRQRRRSGTSPGRSTPVSPTRSRRTSPSNWPIAISIWATA